MRGLRFAAGAAAVFAAGQAMAADALAGEVQRQGINPTAIVMFLAFVVATAFRIRASVIHEECLQPRVRSLIDGSE